MADTPLKACADCKFVGGPYHFRDCNHPDTRVWENQEGWHHVAARTAREIGGGCGPLGKLFEQRIPFSFRRWFSGLLKGL
jgi:hypothetical protein